MNRRPRGGKLLTRSMMHMAARLHYLDGHSQVEVAERMEVSTATVSRLLSLARDEGIVRIQVSDPDEADNLGEDLAARLGLKAVRVVESDRAAAVSIHLASLLKEARLPRRPVLALGWGRMVQAVIATGLPPLPGGTVIPVIGGMDETAAHFQINEFVRLAAEQMGAGARFLHAPSTVSAELRAVLDRDPGVAALTGLWDRADVALLGIGQFPAVSGHAAPRFAPEDVGRVVGDVARHYFDFEGRQILWQGQQGQMSISAEQLRRVPMSIGLATGRDKACAILGAARSGLINMLVTDIRAAQDMADLLEAPSRSY
ncbi:transcriptional regulator [Paracoccus aurantiacus]|uniref:Transcriptional regulator n=1 Tax=Paracoccus aurantiacus TaxID=2599412 RepID=A0A5C6RU63_9RHOB|nr:sugar-binding domain-containing protein [Paracoccus aurantiacus]TXB65647.1 transcriptional regulator [Paracoccus aurantiacus]